MQASNPQLLETIALQIPDALIFADLDGAICVWNRGAEEVFGFAAAEALGQSLDLIVPERLRPAHWAGYRRAVENGRTGKGNEVRVTRSLHKDGRRLYVEMSFGLITDASGKVMGAVAIGRDCSERYATEQALKKRLADLESGTPAS